MVKIKKTILSKKNKTFIKEIIGISIFFILLMLSWNLFKEVGFEISCKDGSVIGVHYTRPPPLCMTCIPNCFAQVEAFYEGELICNNTYNSFGPIKGTSVVVPCKAIDDLVGETVTLNYNVNNSIEYFERKGVEVKIETKK